MRETFTQESAPRIKALKMPDFKKKVETPVKRSQSSVVPKAPVLSSEIRSKMRAQFQEKLVQKEVDNSLRNELQRII